MTSYLVIEQPCDFIYNQRQTEDIVDSLKRFWDVESIGIADSSDTLGGNEQCSRFRYEVNLPWRDLNSNQSTNFDLCVMQLNCLSHV